MKKRLLPLLVVLMFFQPSNAQIGGIVRRAVNRQINNEIDSAFDKKVQDEQNKNRAKNAEEEKAAQQNTAVSTGTEENTGKANASENTSSENAPALGGLFGNKVTLKYKDEYDFTSRIYMVSETYDKDEVLKMDLYMFYSANTPSIGLETNTVTTENSAPVQAKMIMDGENKVFLMLTDVNGMKMGMISELPEENTNIVGPDGKPVKKYTPPTFTKTGNSKVIAGFRCDEYSYTNSEDKTSGKVWYTTDAKLKIDRRGWNNSNMSYYYGSNKFNDGVILANEAYDEKGKLQMKSETKEINENFPHSMSPQGYTLRQMNINKK
jgi:hypothetical protein